MVSKSNKLSDSHSNKSMTRAQTDATNAIAKQPSTKLLSILNNGNSCTRGVLERVEARGEGQQMTQEGTNPTNPNLQEKQAQRITWRELKCSIISRSHSFQSSSQRIKVLSLRKEEKLFKSVDLLFGESWVRRWSGGGIYSPLKIPTVTH